MSAFVLHTQPLLISENTPISSKNPALDIQRRKFYLSCGTALNQALRASSTRTAQATVAPTMGLLPNASAKTPSSFIIFCNLHISLNKAICKQ